MEFHYPRAISHIGKRIEQIKKLAIKRETLELWECWSNKMIEQNDHLLVIEDINMWSIRWVYPCNAPENRCRDRGRCMGLNIDVFLNFGANTGKIYRTLNYDAPAKHKTPQIRSLNYDGILNYRIPRLTPEYHIAWNVGKYMKGNYNTLPIILRGNKGNRLADGSITHSPLIAAFYREVDKKTPFLIPPRIYIRKGYGIPKKERAVRFSGVWITNNKEPLKISYRYITTPYTNIDYGDAEIYKLVKTLSAFELSMHLAVRSALQPRKRRRYGKRTAPKKELPETSLWDSAFE
jgi:hypothetical protein